MASCLELILILKNLMRIFPLLHFPSKLPTYPFPSSRRPIEPNFENASLQELRATMIPASKETQMRFMAIIMLGTGSKRDQVMRACDVTARALRKWIAAFNKRGIDGLIVRKRSGRPGRIPKQTAKTLKEDIENPRKAGREFWTAKAFHGYLKEQYQIDCS